MYVYMGVYLSEFCVHYVHTDAHGGQKVSDTLGLDKPPMWVLGAEARSSERAAKALNVP